MSIVLKDGTVLPDLPTAYTGEKFIASAPDPSTLKYHAIFRFVNNGDLIYYLLFSSDVPLSHISSYMMFVPMAREPLGISDNWTTHMIVEADDYSDAVWLEGACGVLDDPIMSSQAFVPDWSDYDIGTITEFDPENGTVTWGTEIYFHSSVSKPPFVLPDGTELPALPDGCFDGTPYGVVLNVFDQYYSFGVVQHPFCALDTGEEAYGWQSIFQPGRLRSWTLEGDAWVLSEDENYDEPIPGTTSVTSPILWANFDIMYLSDYNEDDGSYTIGTEIARKSDENYRVTGGYMTSIANEARRLGGKTGGMLPAVTEATLRGVTVGGGDGPQLAPNERIYQVGTANATMAANSISFLTNAT